MAIQYNLSDDAYHAIDAVSASQLKIIASQSPLHWHDQYVLGNREDAEHFRIGRAVHCALLEPERFKREYITLPNQSRTSFDGMADILNFFGKTKEDFKGLREIKAFVDEEIAKITALQVSHADMEMIQGIKNAFLRYDYVRDMWRDTRNEITITWEREGVPCKARVDLVGKDFVGELKTTQDASPRAFGREIFSRSYHLSAAWYLEGFRQNGLEALAELPFFLFACEKKSPFALGVYRLDEQVISEGADVANQAFWMLQECKKDNVYPDYAALPQTIYCPAWMQAKEI
jgi:PDDEXK-like domain of unknown function (DUF3799)